MKSLGCLFVLGLCLSSLTYVRSFKCVQCDPDYEDCSDVPINCEEDEHFGDIFDSCFTYNMLIKEHNYSYVHTMKGCSISFGCLHLRDELCENANKTLSSKSRTLKSCSIRCCNEHDYCNAVPPATTATPKASTTEAIVSADVLGYKSGSASQVSMPVCVPLALIVTYFYLN